MALTHTAGGQTSGFSTTNDQAQNEPFLDGSSALPQFGSGFLIVILSMVRACTLYRYRNMIRDEIDIISYAALVLDNEHQTFTVHMEPKPR